eukprot:1338550-Alexandrium_andersonii.AAC.1
MIASHRHLKQTHVQLGLNNILNPSSTFHDDRPLQNPTTDRSAHDVQRLSHTMASVSFILHETT